MNYADVYRDVKAVVEGTPKNLIETVAATIADKLLERYSKLEGVRVELEKPSLRFPDRLTRCPSRWSGGERTVQSGLGHHEIRDNPEQYDGEDADAPVVCPQFFQLIARVESFRVCDVLQFFGQGEADGEKDNDIQADGDEHPSLR